MSNPQSDKAPAPVSGKNTFQAKNGELTVIRMVSGHDLIGRVHSRTDNCLNLLRIIHFMAMPHPERGPGAVSIELAAYQPLLCVVMMDEPFPLKNSQIMFELEPSRPLQHKYTEATSAIQVVDKMPPPPPPGSGIPGLEIAKR